ncbi:uncharacterized protein L199_005747 [Kwoniella botswanensis]|uniref:uncharacterized protein n=1 Tax=Kwoniella botswanensis TaxID=1268659 RepID=UPI00315D46C8
MLFTTNMLALALTSASLLLPSSLASSKDPPSLLEYRSWLPENTCICPYDPLVPEGWLECVGKCASHEKRVHLSTRDLSHLTRQVCVCPEDEQNCPCPLIPPPDCCTPTYKRNELTNVMPALHARSCPPEGEICHVVNGKIECIPCIQERIICPQYKRAEADDSSAIICLATTEGKISCPSCPRPCPLCPLAESKRDTEAISALWCPPCNPPYPPNCPQCWYNAFGTVVCPLCPWPPVTSIKPPKPTITFCPLSRKYCLAQPDGTYKCPGCGPIPIDVEVTDVAGVEPTVAPAK